MGFKKGTLLRRLLVCFLLLLTVIAVKKMDIAIADQTVAFLEGQLQKDYSASQLVSMGQNALKKGGDAAMEAAKRVSQQDVQMAAPVDEKGVKEVWSTNSDLIRYESEQEMQVYAVSGGTVSKISQEDEETAVIQIRHGKDMSSLYSGCTDVYVKRLDKVKKGQIIGAVSPGNGNALRFQICEEGKSVNAESYLPVKKEKK